LRNTGGLHWQRVFVTTATCASSSLTIFSSRRSCPWRSADSSGESGDRCIRPSSLQSSALPTTNFIFLHIHSY
jgi:hypothetical protein